MKEIKQNKMGVMPIPKLLLDLGVPMMLSMLGQGIYNLVDTLFVSMIPGTAQVPEMGDKAINALTLAYPIQMLIIALMVGIGVATNTMLAQSLGRKDREEGSRVAGNAMTVSLCVFALIFLFGLFGARAFIGSQTDDALVAELGTTYLRIVTIFSFGAIGYMCVEKVVMGCGNTKATMLAQLEGTVINIILDPIMIFGWLGLPAMGVAGAAWATVIGQFVSFFMIAYINFFRNKDVDSGLRYLRPRGDILKRVFRISLPATAMQILAPIMSYGMNLILGSISASAVTAFGVYYKLQYFVYLIIYGLNNASLTTTAFNLGLKDKGRIRQSIRFTLLYAFLITAVGVTVLQVFPHALVGLFSIADGSARLCVLALRIASWGILLGGFNTVLPGICQALGNGVYSLTITLLRYVAVLLPLAYGFSLTASADSLVWAAFPIAEGVALCAAALLSRRIYREKTAAL